MIDLSENTEKPLPTKEEVDKLIKDPEVLDELSEIIYKAFEGRSIKPVNKRVD